MTALSNKNLQSMLSVVMGILVIIALSLSGYALNGVIENTQSIAIIESNRFTNNDGLDIHKQISSLKTSVAEVKTENSQYKAAIIRLEGKIDRIDGKLDRLIERND